MSDNARSSRATRTSGQPTDWTGPHADRQHVYCKAGLDREGAALATAVGSRARRRRCRIPTPAPPFSADRRLRRRRRHARLSEHGDSPRQPRSQRAGRDVDRGPRHRERAFEHRAVGRRVDARAPRTRAGGSPRRRSRSPMHGWIDGIASDTLPMSVENVISCSSSGSGGRARPRSRGRRRRARGRAPCARTSGATSFDRRASRRLRARRPRSSASTRGRSSLELVDACGARTIHSRLRCARARCWRASPPCVTMPWTWSPGRRCWRSSPIATCATVNASAALMPSSGAAAACDSRPVYATREVRDRADARRSRSSSGAGCTIIAAWTPSNAPRSSRSTLPPPPSSAGVPITVTREAEIVDERREREPGADRGRRDDVVPARVPDARAARRTRRRSRGAAGRCRSGTRTRSAGRRCPMSTASPASASTPAVHALDCVLLELQLGMRVDAMTEPDERPLRSRRRFHARPPSASIPVASHRARRRRNDRRARRATRRDGAPRRLRRLARADRRSTRGRGAAARRDRRAAAASST